MGFSEWSIGNKIAIITIIVIVIGAIALLTLD